MLGISAGGSDAAMTPQFIDARHESGSTGVTPRKGPLERPNLFKELEDDASNDLSQLNRLTSTFGKHQG
jgi:hypothetical protein